MNSNVEHLRREETGRVCTWVLSQVECSDKVQVMAGLEAVEQQAHSSVKIPIPPVSVERLVCVSM